MCGRRSVGVDVQTTAVGQSREGSATEGLKACQIILSIGPATSLVALVWVEASQMETLNPLKSMRDSSVGRSQELSPL
jgi:hypothetical protein